MQPIQAHCGTVRHDRTEHMYTIHINMHDDTGWNFLTKFKTFNINIYSCIQYFNNKNPLQWQCSH